MAFDVQAPVRIRVSVQTQDFDVSQELACLRAGDAGVGAVVSFVGTVRDQDATLQALELEHYPGMTERAIASIAEAAIKRFELRAVSVVHRVGRLLTADQIVLVAASAAHRAEAFKGCEFVMDYLKTQAPFWKKTHGPKNSCWVQARACDEAAMKRWLPQESADS
jgi:molybdopterin synthase catalytic subunit